MSDGTTPTTTSEATESAAVAAPVVELATETVAATENTDAANSTEKTALGGADAEEGTGADQGDKPEVPDAYELTAPDGLSIDPSDVAAATPIFKELGLTNEQANKLMPVAAQFAQRIGDQLNQQILDGVMVERKSWLTAAEADPEIGGAQWKGSLTTAAKALDGLGFEKGSPFRVLLDESGLGNHPDMIRAWVKVGKAIGEDSKFPRSDSNPAKPKSHAQTLYPKNEA